MAKTIKTKISLDEDSSLLNIDSVKMEAIKI
jgi:hypothetical protein